MLFYSDRQPGHESSDNFSTLRVDLDDPAMSLQHSFGILVCSASVHTFRYMIRLLHQDDDALTGSKILQEGPPAFQ